MGRGVVGRRRGGAGRRPLQGLALRRSPGMKQLCCSGRVLWLGLVLSAFSQEQESKPRKLCGRYLLVEITKLCGQTDWSQFEMDDQTPLTHLAHHSLQTEVKTFSPDQNPSSAWGRFTNPGKTLKGGCAFARQ